jgi:putative NIF3 family GTP cyclohydrolase 1 type 2
VIFKALRRLVYPSFITSAIISAAKNGVTIYAAHTNWDSSHEGVNVTLARLAGFKNIEPLLHRRKGAWGMGAIGALDEPLAEEELASKIMEAWNLSGARIYGKKGKITRAALCGGAGGDLLGDACRHGAEVFITADMSYHDLLEAEAAGMRIIQVHHGEMESAALPELARVIGEASLLEVKMIRNFFTPSVAV